MAKKKKEGVKTFVGGRMNDRQYKRYLATAKSPTERAAIKRFYLGDDAVYEGSEGRMGPGGDAE